MVLLFPSPLISQKAPFNINVGGNNPTGVQLSSGPAGTVVSLSGTRLTVTVPNAGAISSTGTDFAVQLLFSGT